MLTPTEELCTLVITEAFPEDSGLFKCVVHNAFGTVSCSAMLEVYDGGKSSCTYHNVFQLKVHIVTLLLYTPHADLDEQLEAEAIHQEAVSIRQDKEAMSQQETLSCRASSRDFPPGLSDSINLPPPEWPDSAVEDDIPVAE